MKSDGTPGWRNGFASDVVEPGQVVREDAQAEVELFEGQLPLI
jgi:hypothetical protein